MWEKMVQGIIKVYKKKICRENQEVLDLKLKKIFVMERMC